ncbi:MAG: hypothetical protein L3J82_01995 [Planctomycetes bacterium]|nr:hypothetical protein [Planctomycetota bacterium]
MATLLGVFVLINFALIAVEIWGKHQNEDASQTAHDIAFGKSKSLFWVGVLLIGPMLPLIFAFATNAPAAAALGMFIGMAITEYLWVYIPQKRPNV